MREQITKKNNIQTSKLIQLLEALSPLELKRFKKFLASPFHNSNVLLVQLYSLLKKFHPTYDNPQLTREKLYSKLFGNKIYQQKRINDLMYDLRLLVEDFLIVSDTLEKQRNRQIILVDILSKRNHPCFEEESKKLAEKIRQKSTYLTGLDYLALHRTYDQIWSHPDIVKTSGERSVFNANLENLDLFYLFTKLRYYAEYQEVNKIIGIEEEIIYQDLIDNLMKQVDLKIELPLFFIFNQIIKLGAGQLEGEEFAKLRDYVLEHAPYIEQEILRDLVIHFINYCVKKSNNGKNEFIQCSYPKN